MAARRPPPLHVVRVPDARAPDGDQWEELGDLVRDAHAAETTPTAAHGRIAEAEAVDTLRAIGAGEIDAFVVPGGEHGLQVFTLTSADRPYRMFVENMRDGAATVSDDGVVLYANRRLAELLGVEGESIVGAPLASFLAGGFPFAYDELLGPDGRGTTLEVELRRDGGPPVAVLAGTSPLEVEDDRLVCVTFADLSVHKAQEHEIARLAQGQAERLAELQTAQAALTRQATHDALTGLPNRALLVDRIAQALARAHRANTTVAVLFIDLDGFKQVNDTRGHRAGDELLRDVAASLVGTLRSVDTIARIGGDEFVALAPDLTDHLDAIELSARLLDALAATGVAASVGLSVASAGSGDPETMLGEADAAMYHAKSLGGGRVEVFDEQLGRQIQDRTAARTLLQEALDDARVTARYQPIVDLATGAVTGFEALVRIEDHDGSLVAPSAFVPAAEDSGLVTPLGTRMLGLACGETSRWRTADAPLSIAINLSSRQFETGDLTAIVHATLEETGLAPARLHLELTETAMMDLRPGFLRQLRLLRELGVQIGLDDFGTGYASLTHLRRLPLDFVKIDRSFVAGLGGDGGDDRIVAAVIDLAANFGLRSIAEGVETAGQLERLRALGCDQAQGYLFARPLAPGRLVAFARRRTW